MSPSLRGMILRKIVILWFFSSYGIYTANLDFQYNKKYPDKLKIPHTNCNVVGLLGGGGGGGRN